MSDYISREAIKDAMLRYGFKAPDMTVTEFVEDELPATDVEPVWHGRWVGRSGLFQGECSVCGYRTYDKTADWARKYWTYCPNCGVKMELEDENNDD